MSNYRTFDYYDLKYIEWDFRKSSGKFPVSTLQSIITFDIETSNGFRLDNGDIIGLDQKRYDSDDDYKHLIDSAEPQSLLYVWQCAVESANGDIYTFLGRTWEDYLDFVQALTSEIKRAEFYGGKGIDALGKEYIDANLKKRKIRTFCFIHNFGFEFQHLRNIFEDEFTSTKGTKMSRVFARNARKPMKANISVNGVGIEFRDSLVLVGGKSLKKWGEDENLTVKKLEEPKDYYLPIRTPETPLTDEELDYSENDVVTMVYGLRKYRDKYELIQNIPLTQTGEVRLKCRQKVSIPNIDWAELCTLNTKGYTLEFFRKLTKLFSGGWTHANATYTGVLLNNVRCYDFASSYPACMTMRTYPIGSFQEVDVKSFKKYESQDLHSPNLKYHWFAKIRVYGVQTKLYNTFWSLSKCEDIILPVDDTGLDIPAVDNGRVYQMEEMEMYITDLDWDVFKNAYSFRDYEVKELYIAESGYLPKELILTILDYYKYKTSLKDVSGSESRYAESKQFINSIYGCFVTRDFSDEIQFVKVESDSNKDEFWQRVSLTEDMFEDKKSKTDPQKTFGCFQLGCWVTAWARHNLWDAIIHFDRKTVYCDTDSCKGLYTDADTKWFDDYNENIADIQKIVAEIVGFDPKLYCPKTPKGTPKRLGIFAEEDTCIEYKTLGAKRYVDLVYNKKTGKNEIQATIAGIPKKCAAAKFSCVDDFQINTVWNTQESGKLTAIYTHNQTRGIWIDRDGNRYDPYKNSFYPKYGICLKPTTFNLSLSNDYENFLRMIEYGTHDFDNEDFLYDIPDILR